EGEGHRQDRAGAGGLPVRPRGHGSLALLTIPSRSRPKADFAAPSLRESVRWACQRSADANEPPEGRANRGVALRTVSRAFSPKKSTSTLPQRPKEIAMSW